MAGGSAAQSKSPSEPAATTWWDLTGSLGENPTVLQLFEANQQFELISPEDIGEFKRISISVIADSTMQGLTEPLRYFCRCLKLEPAVSISPSYQIEAQLSDLESESARAKPMALLVLMDIEKLLPNHSNAPDEIQTQRFKDLLTERLDLCRAFAKRSAAKVYLTTFVASLPPLSSAYSHIDSFGRSRFIEQANHWLSQLCLERSLELVALHSFFAEWGLQRCLSLKDYLSSDSLFSAEGYNRLALIFARQLAASFTRRRKVLVVDLDHTLWGGILGEDGIDGIQYRPDSYAGRVYSHIISHLKQLSETGVILAVVSKNNEAEALEVFKREDFPLKAEDFAALRINWSSKPENLISIAEELGVGLESMVMLDDSDSECLQIRQSLPEVAVMQVPKKLSDYPALLSKCGYFERPQVTESDLLRKQDYQNLHKRKRLAENASSVAAFLSELKPVLTLFKANRDHLSRLEQLFERTNQFNLSAERYSKEQLEQHLAVGGIVLGASYQDIFGSSGVVGALVASQSGAECVVRNFVLSCRVLGRQVEYAIIGGMLKNALPSTVKSLRFSFKDTGRNLPAQQFLRALNCAAENRIDTSSFSAPQQISVIWSKEKNDVRQ